MQRRHCPHGGRGNNHIGKNHSETNGEGHAAGLFMHKCQGPSSSTAAPIDKKLVNDPLESDEVRTVLSKGYKRTDVASVVEAILKAGGIITVDKLMRALGRIRARRIVRK
ncbi:uncharacterized protein LOC128552149 [Mercenaria mercenaria]|uniref:uncharacterized protein LOC128552149 n=1 Tax=Mercenaria mercenaria TaxID=6596 RepID=UPI00234E3A11|nr:uncharacterized protein LOC128552149 [Mercenaria mercenaria]